jgi:hypothetical protein
VKNLHAFLWFTLSDNMKLLPSRLAFASLLLFQACPLLAVTPEEAVAKIDQLVLDNLAANQLKPNAVASDEVFVRRAYLDLIGRIPTKQETLTFLESTNSGKRAGLVDSLVGSDGYVSHQYNYFADLFRAKTTLAGTGQSVPAGLAYEQWVKESIRKNKPYNKLVYEMVTASGSTWNNPAIGYYIRDFGMNLDNLAITSQVFLGTQIVCAQCHNHPFDQWTQMDYYHLAAFTNGMVGTNNHPIVQKALDFMEEKKGKRTNKELEKSLKKAASEILFPVRFNNINQTDRSLRLPHDYKYDDAKPKSIVEPATLMGNAAVLSGSQHPSEAFGEWLTSPENPRFTKVIANRLWKRTFGLGLIEPADDIKESTIASNPELMTYLEELMVALNYDIQAMQRILYRTDAYQRESTVEEPVPGEPYHFAGPILRRMSAEQIWDSLVSMTIDEADSMDAGRKLLAEKRIATVQLIAESVYDQRPAQFLRNMQQVLKIQGELSAEIEVAQTKVAKARESGDPDLIHEATEEAKAIKKQLDIRIEETVYRDGLSSKLALAKPGKEVVSSAGNDDALMNELAATLTSDNRSIEDGMTAITGPGEENGIIDDLVDSMFETKDRELEEQNMARQNREMADWNVKTKEEKKLYKSFNKIYRGRMKRASELNSPAPAGHFLREFGQSDRELVENSNDQAAITQSLALLNGTALSSLTNRYSVLSRSMKGEKFDDRLDTIYLTMLSRHPTNEEKAIFKEAWTSNPESGSFSGIVWTVLNTRQFLFNQ